MVVLITVPALGQPAAPTDRFAWDQEASSLAVASAYRYDVEIDSGAPVVLVSTCTGVASPFVCSAAIPAVTPTTHVARVRAVDPSPTPIVSAWSAPLTFTMRATPATPAGLRIIPGA
jgi:hypothetical protein